MRTFFPALKEPPSKEGSPAATCQKYSVYYFRHKNGKINFAIKAELRAVRCQALKDLSQVVSFRLRLSDDDPEWQATSGMFTWRALHCAV